MAEEAKRFDRVPLRGGKMWAEGMYLISAQNKVQLAVRVVRFRETVPILI